MVVVAPSLARCAEPSVAARSGAPRVQGIEGEWLGEMLIDDSAHQVHLTLWRCHGDLGGAVDLPSMSGFGIPLDRVTVGPAVIQMSFDKSSGGWSAGRWSFACKFEGGQLMCEAAHDGQEHPLELSRVALRPIAGPLAERYAGYYERDSGAMTLARAGNHLLRTDEGRVVELYPLSETAYTSDGKETVTFEVDGAGRVVAATIATGPSASRARRLDLPYATREITFANGAVKLRGTLRVPLAAGLHAAVVMVHGSAPGEGYQPYFEVIADHFARHGIAVFAYDKRGWGLSNGDWRNACFGDLAGDALAAIGTLQREPGVDAKRIGLWGISQAGWILPLAASRSRNVAFLILASSPAVSPAEQELSRVEHEMRADGVAQHLIDEARAFEKLFVDVALGKTPRAEMERAMREAKGKEWAGYPAVLQAGVSPNSIDAALRITAEARDPAAILGRVLCPVLAIYGALDQTVRTDENRRRIKGMLLAGGNADVTVVVVPGADHAFFPTKSGGRQELLKATSGRIVFASGFLEQMTDWLIRHTMPGRDGH